MIDNGQVFERFEKISAYTFATINDDYPQTRIAHFLTYDNEGIYFQTMKVKPFYRQLKKTGKVSVCSLAADMIPATHDENGLPDFPAGFSIRVSGDVRELSFEELEKKAEADKRFLPLIRDIERYPTMTTFVLFRYRGDIFDYDFEKVNRDHKVERESFSFGGMAAVPSGFTIDSGKCIACGQCADVCTFNAIVPGDTYSIMGERCDECGSCYVVCPVDAVKSKVRMDEEDRVETGKRLKEYYRK